MTAVESRPMPEYQFIKRVPHVRDAVSSRICKQLLCKKTQHKVDYCCVATTASMTADVGGSEAEFESVKMSGSLVDWLTRWHLRFVNSTPFADKYHAIWSEVEETCLWEAVMSSIPSHRRHIQWQQGIAQHRSWVQVMEPTSYYDNGSWLLSDNSIIRNNVDWTSNELRFESNVISTQKKTE